MKDIHKGLEVFGLLDNPDVPITITAYIAPAERDVVLMNEYLDDYEITHVNGQPCTKNPKTLYEYLATPDGEKALEHAVFDALY